MTDGRPAGAIGYVPFSPGLDRPGDRRRFPAYADRRSLAVELVDHGTVMAGDGPDVVVLSSNADMTTWARVPEDLRVVVDVPDAVLEERAGFRSTFRGVAKWAAGANRRPVLDYRRALVQVLQRADTVVCSTPEQQALLSEYCDRVHPILDVHAEFGSHEPIRARASDSLDVVWEGMVATLPALAQVVSALRSLVSDRPVRLHVVTDRRYPRYMERFGAGDSTRLLADWEVPVALYQWDPVTLAAIARTCDLAVVPVELDDPQARGKPENRMRIFWRLGLPVLASDSPANRRAVRAAGLPAEVLCGDEDDWHRALRWIVGDADVRDDVARRGNTASNTIYGDEAIVAGWDAAMADVGIVAG